MKWNERMMEGRERERKNFPEKHGANKDER